MCISRSDQRPIPHGDYGRSGDQSPATGAAAAGGLGNLRNTYAGAGDQGGANPHDQTEKSGSNPSSKTTRGQRRQERFELQREAAKLTPDMRVAHCLWTATGATVDLVRRQDDARFIGVQTCGSVWVCPCCSARISEVRRRELRQLEEWAGSPLRGLRLVMMTLTARHRNRRLGDMVDRLAKAKRRMQNRKAWQRLRDDGTLFGTVSVREATHGKNGWHPHYHVLCLVEADSDEAAQAALEPMRSAWIDCLRKEGLTGTLERAFDLQNGDAVAAYISKHGRDEKDRAEASEARSTWGISEEMTLARTKRGLSFGSRSPWQILRDAASGDEASAALWQEYARVMHGRRQQVWSNGLKEACGLIEVEDEAAAEGEEFTEDEDERLATWPKATWKRIRHRRGEILAAAETGGAAAVDDLTARTLSGETQDDAEALVEEWFERTEAEEAEQARWDAETQEFRDWISCVDNGEQSPELALICDETAADEVRNGSYDTGTEAGAQAEKDEPARVSPGKYLGNDGSGRGGSGVCGELAGACDADRSPSAGPPRQDRSTGSG